MGKKLNIKWVSDTIEDDYKDWNSGDTIIIKAQTGTGKTHFIQNKLIPNMMPGETIMIVCNRVNLKRQFKLDLMKDYDSSLIPYREVERDGKFVQEIDFNALDKISVIGNIVVLSYQSLAKNILDKKYEVEANKQFDIKDFDYLVLDECHFMYTDSSFNNTSYFITQKLIYEYLENTVKIFMSATPEEVTEPIRQQALKGNVDAAYSVSKVVRYDTGVDYSYLNLNYFKYIDDIVKTIKNDKSDEKWLIFVTKLDDAQVISEELGEGISNSIIKAGTKDSEDLNGILENSKFKSKVLICTKAMDNGINIKDKKLKHVVIMAWDKTTFIQELGRVRIDINNAPEIQLYIPQRSGRNFNTFLNKIYYPKRKILKLFKDARNEFNRKYDMDYHKLPKDLFYQGKKGWAVNKSGVKRLRYDIEFCKEMVGLFKLDDTAFLVEQTAWLDRDDYFNAKWIEDVILEDDKNNLVSYLDSIVDKKLFAEEQQKLSDMILNELVSVGSNVNYRTKKLKPTTLGIILQEELNLNYEVSKTKKESKGENRGKRYITITKNN